MRFPIFRALITRLIPAVILSLNVACSHHWREGHADVSDQDLQEIFNESLAGDHSGDSGFGIMLANEFLNDDPKHTGIYWNEAPRPNHALKSVLIARSLEFLIPPKALSDGPVVAARVLFFTNTTSHRVALIIALIQSGSYKKTELMAARATAELTYYSFAGTYTIDGGKYVAEFIGNDKKPFTLKSIDVEDDHLAGIVQLIANDYGGDHALAKFPTLHGIDNQ